MSRPFIINAQDYYDWAKNRKSQSCIYHEGHLQQDRVEQSGKRRDSVKPVAIIDDLAKIVWQDYESSKVSLFQKRIGENRFQYIAVKGVI